MKNVFLYLLMLAPALLFSQSNITFEISDAIKDPGYGVLTSAVIGADGQGIYVLKDDEKRLAVKTTQKMQVFDKSMNITKETEIKVNKKENGLLEFLNLGEKTYMVMYKNNANNKSISIYGRAFDPLKANTTGDRLQLVNLPNTKLGSKFSVMGFGGADKGFTMPEFFYSTDSSKVLLTSSRNNKRNQNDEYLLGVFDENLKKVWGKKSHYHSQRKNFNKKIIFCLMLETPTYWEKNVLKKVY